MNPIALKALPISTKDEKSVEVPAPEEDEDLSVGFNDVKSTQVEVQRVIESPIQVFKATDVKRCVKAMMETKVISFL